MSSAGAARALVCACVEAALVVGAPIGGAAGPSTAAVSADTVPGVVLVRAADGHQADIEKIVQAGSAGPCLCFGRHIGYRCVRARSSTATF